MQCQIHRFFVFSFTLQIVITSKQVLEMNNIRQFIIGYFIEGFYYPFGIS